MKINYSILEMKTDYDDYDDDDDNNNNNNNNNLKVCFMAKSNDVAE